MALPSKLPLLLAVLLCPPVVLAQGLLWLDRQPVPETQLLAGDTATASAPAKAAVPLAPVTIPAGTRVLLALKSPLHTTSGTAGSGLYLESAYAVVQDDKVVIPAHTQVQGMVEKDKRPGHLQRGAAFTFRFTSLIFPNNHVVSIDGGLQSLPGSRIARVEHDDGELRTVDQPEKVLVPAAVGAVGGAVLGSVRRFGIGTYTGAGLGAGLGLGGTLLQRGDEITLPAGTKVEMVLRRPVNIQPEQAAFNAQYVAPPEARVETREAENDREDPPKLRRTRPLRRSMLGGIFFQHE